MYIYMYIYTYIYLYINTVLKNAKISEKSKNTRNGHRMMKMAKIKVANP